MSWTRRRAVFAAATLWMCAAVGAEQAASPRQSAEPVRLNAGATRVQPSAQADLNATVKQYCAGCHNERAKSEATATGVILDGTDVTRAGEHPELWEKVVRRLRTGSMPPAGMPKPDAATTRALLEHLEGTLDRAATARPNPGRHPA